MLAGKTAFGLVAVLTVMAASIFIPARTLHYWQAWLFLCVYAICNVLVVAYLWKTDQASLKAEDERRAFSEGKAAQKVIMGFASIGFIALLIVPALDHRLRWSNAPPVVAVIGDVLVACGFFVTTLVFRENSFAAATIQVTDEQRVVSTGPYAIVRHPMYAGGLVFDRRHPTRARFILGTRRGRRHASGSGLAASRRRSVFVREPNRIQSVSVEGSMAPDTGGFLAGEGRSYGIEKPKER